MNLTTEHLQLLRMLLSEYELTLLRALRDKGKGALTPTLAADYQRDADAAHDLFQFFTMIQTGKEIA